MIYLIYYVIILIYIVGFFKGIYLKNIFFILVNYVKFWLFYFRFLGLLMFFRVCFLDFLGFYGFVWFKVWVFVCDGVLVNLILIKLFCGYKWE